MRIGLDFDNTIACYDRAFSFAVHDMGLLPDGLGDLSKEEIKVRIRALPDGERQWQRLQGRAYGFYIGHACLFDGFTGFVLAARATGHHLVVISHKTQFGHFDPDHIDLCAAARKWMAGNGFFDILGFTDEDVNFSPTRGEKLSRIAHLDCSHFIDDLPEILLDPQFPATTRPLLFAPGGGGGSLPAYESWAALRRTLLT